jgi:predicted outer membrane repeat protein
MKKMTLLLICLLPAVACNALTISITAEDGIVFAGCDYAITCDGGEGIISWSGPGTFWIHPSGTSATWNAPHQTGHATITVTDQVNNNASITVWVQNVIYVDKDAIDGHNNGTSWSNAFTSLQSALSKSAAGNEIWVAEGTYKPSAKMGAAERSRTFQLVRGVKLYGGFGGTETSLNQRDLSRQQTILSGDIDNDDIFDDDNAWHVVVGYDNTYIDGFTITNGYANDSLPDNRGAGMLNNYGSPTVVNCIFIRNYASDGGGAIYLSSSNSVILNCSFIENEASMGGAIYASNCNFSISNCRFIANLAEQIGGAVRNYGWPDARGNLVIKNCLFNQNMSERFGGAISNNNADVTIDNCTIVANEAGDYYGGVEPGVISSHILSSCEINNCIIYHNIDSQGTGEPSQINPRIDVVTINYSCLQGWTGLLGGIGNTGADPCFVDPNNNDYHLLSDSACINAGDPNYILGPNETDLDGNPRVIDGRIDMGAYEYNESEPPVEAAMKLTPQTLNCNGKGNLIAAHITLPAGILPEDIDVNTPAVLEPAGIESEYIKLLGKEEPVQLQIDFSRAEFCQLVESGCLDELIEDGRVLLTVTGRLTTGQYFYATDTIKVLQR